MLSLVTADHPVSAAGRPDPAASAGGPLGVDAVVRQVDLLGDADLELVAGMLGVPSAQLAFVWRRAIDEGFLVAAGPRYRTTTLGWLLLAA